MLSLFLGILTFALIVVSIFLILVVLAHKSKSDGGVGAAMGGGMAEATFGAETSNVLSKMTIWAAILFFALSLSLYMGRLYQARSDLGGGTMPVITGTTAPAADAAAVDAAVAKGLEEALSKARAKDAATNPPATPPPATPNASTTSPATPVPAAK